jgi:methylglutaconyl-CoA hydratase
MVTSEIRRHAGYITMNRPEKRNALNLELTSRLIEALGKFGRDDRVRCIVLGAAGPVFCAGADIREAGSAGPKGINLYADLIERILSSPRPVIARVQGPVLAGGVGIVAACQLAAASESATFTTPELKSDLFPLMVYSLISARAGTKLTLEMALCLKALTGPEAVRAGLINAAVPPEKLDETVETWVETICGWNPEVVASGLGATGRIRSARILENVRECQRIIDDLDSKRSP